jgi:uncharacterized small protein (DUF1192 family)
MFGLKTHKRLTALEEDFRKLRSEMDVARLDYLNLYGKAKSLFGKIAKAESLKHEEESPQLELPGILPGARLSDRQAALQREILRRRAERGTSNGAE